MKGLTKKELVAITDSEAKRIEEDLHRSNNCLLADDLMSPYQAACGEFRRCRHGTDKQRQPVRNPRQETTGQATTLSEKKVNYSKQNRQILPLKNGGTC